MHVILTPVGSAGDMNPFVIVGRELQTRGHRVTLIAPAVFAGLAQSAGLSFAQLGTAEEFDRVTSNPDLWDPRRGVAVVFRELAARLRQGYEAIERLYEPKETVLVGHALSLSTRVFEETHGAPAVTLHLAPSIFRSDFQQPALPSGHDISGWPVWAKRLLWRGVDRFAIDPLIAPQLNRWRAELGLSPVSRIFKTWLHSPQLVLGLFPAWFGEPQRDWPPQLRLTGFVLSDESCVTGHEDAAARSALERFLAPADPPIVFTPGSANRHAAEFFRVAIEATAAIGRRALLVTSYREHLPASLPPSVHHAEFAAFATVFPRAAAVVHHGGIGTCAQALAAGLPQIIMPMGFDQPDNALRLARLRVGTAIRPARFTPDRVARALEDLLSNASVAAACQHWRHQIDSAAAVRCAADLIEAQADRTRIGRVEAALLP